jgi:hypothetical protein
MDLIDRAVRVLAYDSERDAVVRLVNTGVEPSEAYLAVQAAKILVRDHEKAEAM